MKTLRLRFTLAAATLGLSALSFSQLSSPPSGPSQPLATAQEVPGVTALNEGYFVRNGTSYFTQNGNVFRVEREATLRVTPTGMVAFDGQPLLLPPGMMITNDGRHAPIPRGVSLPLPPGTARPVVANDPPAPPRDRTPAPAISDLPTAPGLSDQPR